MKLKDYLKALEKRNRWAELRFAAKFKRDFNQAFEPSINAIASNPTDALQQLPLLIKRDIIYNSLKWLYVDYGLMHAKWFLSNFPMQRKSDDTFWLQHLERTFSTIGANKVTSIVNTTLDIAKPLIQDAIAASLRGDSIDKIKDDIKKRIKNAGGVMSDGRARTIARTEVIGASNKATYEAIKLTDSKVEKKWITGGTNIRDTHKEAANQGWIPFDDFFRVGDSQMLHPSDPNGSAKEIINCKCVLIFRLVN